MKVFEEYIIPINETAKDYDEMFVAIIRRQPVLIRCKDCKHWTVTCDDDYQSCECDALIRHKDFYCANGERKDNG